MKRDQEIAFFARHRELHGIPHVKLGEMLDSNKKEIEKLNIELINNRDPIAVEKKIAKFENENMHIVNVLEEKRAKANKVIEKRGY